MEDLIVEFYKGIDAIKEKYKDKLGFDLDKCFRLYQIPIEDIIFDGSYPLDPDIRSEIIYLYSRTFRK